MPSSRKATLMLAGLTLFAAYAVASGQDLAKYSPSFVKGIVEGCIDSQRRLLNEQGQSYKGNERVVQDYCYCMAPITADLSATADGRNKLTNGDPVVILRAKKMASACLEGVRNGRHFTPDDHNNSSSAPQAIFSPTGLVVGFAKLLGSDDIDGCNPVMRTGRVTHFDRSSDSKSIAGFDMQSPKSEAISHINLDTSHLTAIDVEILADLFKNVTTVSTLAYQCGASGRVNFADSIQFNVRNH